jgi:hypothetical protein
MDITLSKSNTLPWYWLEILKMTQVGYSFKYHPYFSFICFCSYLFIQYFPSKYSIHLGFCLLPENLIPSSSHTFIQSRSLFTLTMVVYCQWIDIDCQDGSRPFAFQWLLPPFQAFIDKKASMYVRILILGGPRLGYCKNQPICVTILGNSR